MIPANACPRCGATAEEGPGPVPRHGLSNKALYAIRILLLQSIDEAKERMWQDKQENLENILAEFDAWRRG